MSPPEPGPVNSSQQDTNITDAGTSRPIILNAVLTYLHSLMSQMDKSHIQNIIVARYDLIEIKKAREILFRKIEPTVKYVYQGPKGKHSARDKAVHAFDSLFTKMQKLDVTASVPIFASDELTTLLSATNHSLCEAKFTRLEAEMKEIKQTFHTFTNLVTSKQGFPETTTGTPVTVSAIPADVRSRCNSTSSVKRRRLSEGDDATPSEFESCSHLRIKRSW